MKLGALLEGEVGAGRCPPRKLGQCPGGPQLPPHADPEGKRGGIPAWSSLLVLDTNL